MFRSLTRTGAEDSRTANIPVAIPHLGRPPMSIALLPTGPRDRFTDEPDAFLRPWGRDDEGRKLWLCRWCGAISPRRDYCSDEHRDLGVRRNLRKRCDKYRTARGEDYRISHRETAARSRSFLPQDPTSRNDRALEPSVELRNLIIALYASGLNTNEVGGAVGYSGEKVRMLLHRWRQPVRKGARLPHHDEADAVVRRIRQAGNSLAEIAAELGVSNAAVSLRVKRLGLARKSRPVLRREDVLEIRRLLASGARQVDIAKTYGISPSVVSSIKIGRHWKGVV